MADPTTSSGLNQAGLTALLQRLGLGQFIGGANGTSMGGQTVGGQPVQYDPRTININNAGSQGGFSDQMLEGTQLPPGFAVGGGSPATGQGYGNAGSNFVGSPGNPQFFYPTSDKAASDFRTAQTQFNRNQVNSIEKLLGGLNNQSAAAPQVNVSQLNSKLPISSPVVNGPGVGFTAPSAANIPGVVSMAQPVSGSLPSLSNPVSAPSNAALEATQAMIAKQASLPSAPGASPLQMQKPFTIIPVAPTGLASKLAAGNIQPSDIMGAGGPPQASVESGIQPRSMPAPVSMNATPIMRSYSPPPPLATTIMPSGHAGQSGYAATSAPVSGGVAASGGQGYLPASANTGPTVGPTVVPGAAGGLTTDPNVASANQPTSSSATSGGGMTPQMGSAIASGIGAIGKALMPQNIQNPAVGRPINPNLLPRPITFTAPVMV